MKKQKKQAGFIVSAELVLIATILVIGLIVGMVAIRDALTAAMGDVAEAIGSLDQSYTDNGIFDEGTQTAIAGSALLVVLYLPALQVPFGTFAMPLADLAIVLGVAATVLPVLDVAKAVLRQR